MALGLKHVFNNEKAKLTQLQKNNLTRDRTNIAKIIERLKTEEQPSLLVRKQVIKAVAPRNMEKLLKLAEQIEDKKRSDP